MAISTIPLPRGAYAYPLELALPGNKRAQLIEGSVATGRPIYQLDGVALDLDITIPPDLIDLGWFWWGSYLAHCWEPTDPLRTISIDTALHPPPACYEVARSFGQPDEAGLAARVKRQRAPASTKAAVQMEMSL